MSEEPVQRLKEYAELIQKSLFLTEDSFKEGVQAYTEKAQGVSMICRIRKIV